MQRRATGVVDCITAERPGAQELLVRLFDEALPDRDASQSSDQGRMRLRPAINLLALNAPVSVGQRVLINTAAVEMGLGTGGFDFVVCPLDTPGLDESPTGHVMKLRYTPLQTPVLSVEAPESQHHATIFSFDNLNQCPVVCAELHSQVPAICAAARWGLREAAWPHEPRIVYIMTDGGALPMALSRLVPAMKAAGLIQATLTSGQAFGGDYEAVNLYSALAAARTVCRADVIVVAQGPGSVGTDTPLGFSGIEQGLAINATGSLGGIPIVAARISFADPRDRHHAVSHHTLTVLKRVALVPALVAVPRLPPEQLRVVCEILEDAPIRNMHQTVVVTSDRALEDFKRTNLDVTTMGRGVNEDRALFLAATAAGLLAAQVVEAGLA